MILNIIVQVGVNTYGGDLTKEEILRKIRSDCKLSLEPEQEVTDYTIKKVEILGLYED